MTIYVCCDHCPNAPHAPHKRPCGASCGGSVKLHSKAPSSPVETTEPVSGTTSYTGVIRGADEADECAHTALSLIYRRERDEARDERDAALAKVKRMQHALILGPDAPTEPVPELERESDAPSGVTQHPCDCARHVSYRAALAFNADDRRAL